jgi:hypothetical protein
MIKRTMWALGLAIALAALTAAAALAAKGGAGTETLTSHEIEGFAFPAANPCTGEAGLMVASPTNAVFHLTTQANGDFWVTGTDEGTATFLPSGAGPVFTGHFTAWFGESANRHNTVEHDTDTFDVVGPEGSHVILHSTSHLSTNGKGVVTVENEREHMHTKCV